MLLEKTGSGGGCFQSLPGVLPVGSPNGMIKGLRVTHDTGRDLSMSIPLILWSGGMDLAKQPGRALAGTL